MTESCVRNDGDGSNLRRDEALDFDDAIAETADADEQAFFGMKAKGFIGCRRPAERALVGRGRDPVPDT